MFFFLLRNVIKYSPSQDVKEIRDTDEALTLHRQLIVEASDDPFSDGGFFPN